MRALLLVVTLALVGCGIEQLAGVSCKINSDCSVGLSCLPTVAPNASGVCSDTGKKTCTKQCVSSDECLKTAPVCVTSCAGLKTCGNATR